MENNVWFESEQEAREWFLAVLEGEDWYGDLCTDPDGRVKRYYLTREYIGWCCAILPMGGFLHESEVKPLLREVLRAHADEVAEWLMHPGRRPIKVRHDCGYAVGYTFNEAGKEEPLFNVSALLCKELNGKTPRGLYVKLFHPY